MKKKKIIGIVIILLGVIVFLLGMRGRGQVAEARHNVETSTSFFQDSAAKKEVTGAMERKIGSYDMPVMLTIIGGIAIVIIGICTVVSSRKK